MAKKTREELIAEANAPKGGNAQEPTEAEKAEAEAKALEDAVNTPDAPLSPEAQAAADAVMAASEEQVLAEEGRETDPDEPGEVNPRHAAAEAALKKLWQIFQAYPVTAPREHVCFGNGGGKFTLGEFRDLMVGMPPE